MWSGDLRESLREAGVSADGVDLDPLCPFDICDVFSQAFLDKYGKQNYDLCLCLEVAEHLPEERATEFVQRLVRVAPTVLFSAAFPGQGGHGHINCQPKSYWIAKFNRENYVLDEVATKNVVEFMRSGYHMGWFVSNTMVFRSYGSTCYEQIVREETPQAARLAEYLKAVTF